jgi:hypothetical protein
MLSPAFISHQFAKRNSKWVVEQCDAIRAADLPRRDGQPYLPHPETPIHAVKSGACVRWYFECPGCDKLVETLYRLPADDVEPLDCRSAIGRLGYACRSCHRLVYASQRYGKNHPLRQVLTSRKRRHRGFGKPYLNRRKVMRRAVQWMDAPEPTRGHRLFQYAVAMLDAAEVMSSPDHLMRIL